MSANLSDEELDLPVKKSLEDVDPKFDPSHWQAILNRLEEHEQTKSSQSLISVDPVSIYFLLKLVIWKHQTVIGTHPVLGDDLSLSNHKSLDS